MTAITEQKISLGQIEDIPFSHLTNKPTTLSGYGITDAYTKSEIDSMVGTETLQSVTDNGKTTTNDITVNGITNNSSYVQNASNWTMNGRNWVLTFPNDTHSSTSFTIRNSVSTNPGGMFMTERGSLIVRARGDSITDYYIVRLQDSNSSGRTVFDVAGGGVTKVGVTVNSTYGLLRVGGGASFDNTIQHSKAILSNESMTFGQYKSDEIVVTGLKRFRRGSSGAEILHSSFEYPDGDGETFNLRLFNEGVENSVMWYLRQNHNDNREDYVMGFEHGVTIVGTNRPSATIIDDIDTELANNTGDPNYRYPISLYAVRDTMVEGRGYFGKDNFSNTSFLTSDDTLYSEGTVYGKKGIRTADPDNPATVFDHTTWLLGGLSVNSQTESTHTLRASIDGVLVDIMVRSV